MSNWEKLLERALSGLDSLEENGTPIRWWSFGGGTALMAQVHHRDSKDIDLFVPDPQCLGYLSPRLTDPDVWGGPDYDEAAHYVKLSYAEGEIDFIAATSVSDLPNGAFAFQGREIAIEPAAEIILKKLHYRAGLLKPRDVFDTAVVLASPGHADSLRDHLPLLSDVRDKLLGRLDAMPDDYFQAAMAELAIFPEWASIVSEAKAITTELVHEIPAPAPHPIASRTFGRK